jgi:uncharacterized membrane protein (Fun14 family)
MVKAFGRNINFGTVGNVCLGAGLGLASGYSYHKYSRVSSMGFGIGFLVTGLKKKMVGYLDLNKDGKLDHKDVEVVEEALGLDITWVGVVTFAGGFGTGYLVGGWF